MEGNQNYFNSMILFLSDEIRYNNNTEPIRTLLRLSLNWDYITNVIHLLMMNKLKCRLKII